MSFEVLECFDDAKVEDWLVMTKIVFFDVPILLPPLVVDFCGIMERYQPLVTPPLVY